MQLRVADLVRDADMLAQVIEISDALYATEPKRAAALVARWNSGQLRYAKV